MPIAEWLRVVGERAIEGFAAGCDETNCAVVKCKHDDVAFVDLAMMKAAQSHKVGELRFAAMSPVPDVMPVEIASVWAAGKTTAAFVA